MLAIFISLISLFVVSSSFSQVSRNFDKQKKPLYELGGGFINLNIPNYPGASLNTPRVIFFPWILYESNTLVE